MFKIYVIGCNKTRPKLLFSGETLDGCYSYLNIDENYSKIWTNFFNKIEKNNKTNSDNEYEVLTKSFFNKYDFKPIIKLKDPTRNYLDNCSCIEDIYIFESKSDNPNEIQLRNAMRRLHIL